MCAESVNVYCVYIFVLYVCMQCIVINLCVFVHVFMCMVHVILCVCMHVLVCCMYIMYMLYVMCMYCACVCTHSSYICVEAASYLRSGSEASVSILMWIL